jgi:hypothetical protein
VGFPSRILPSLAVLSVAVAVHCCASTQLNYNTLDLASTADHLLTGQVLHNLALFIDSDAAIPSQIVINGGTATTANTITPSFSTPLSKAVTLGTSIAAAGTGAITSTSLTNSGVTAAKTLSVGASNVATQNWAYDPVSDADQLRRLHALYRFAVEGNDKVSAQATLIRDYPLVYRQDKNGNLIIDDHALKGPNCVVCVCAHGGYKRSDAPKSCLAPNRRLLPTTGRRWLLWTSLPGANRPSSNPPPSENDFLLGQYGFYLLYVDLNQADRLSQFELFIAAAATSAPSPSGGGSSAPSKPKSSIAVTPGILLAPAAPL